MKDNIEAIRTRLSMRESFFGGPLNTRDASRTAGPMALKRKATDAKPTGRESSDTKRSKATSLVDRLEPVIDSEALKREKRRKNRDFSGLKDAVVAAPVIPSKKRRTLDNGPEHHQQQQKVDVVARGVKSPPSLQKERSILDSKHGPPKNVMKKTHRTTALGMQTVQLVTRRGPKPPSPIKPSPPSRPNNNAYISTSSPYSKQEQKDKTKVDDRLRFRGAFYGSQQPPSALHKRRSLLESESESDSMLSGFIDDEGVEEEEDYDSEEYMSGGKKGGRKGEKEEDWRAALKDVLGGYDASKFSELDKMADKRMEASYEQILDEETQAAKLARAIDRREALLEAQRRRQEELEDEEDEKERSLEKKVFGRLRKKQKQKQKSDGKGTGEKNNKKNKKVVVESEDEGDNDEEFILLE